MTEEDINKLLHKKIEARFKEQDKTVNIREAKIVCCDSQHCGIKYKRGKIIINIIPITNIIEIKEIS